MKWLSVILICFCSCSTTTKVYILDSSESQGNLVKREWNLNGLRYDTGVTTKVEVKEKTLVQLMVTDNKGRKDSATIEIK